MMQCREGKPLPADLQQFMDSATEGVLLVSFGSVLQGSQVPQDKLAALLEAFGRLKEKVLFKWETDTLPGKPANVLLKSFLPQQDLLAHPNLKGFVTHAGYLSFEEALCHQTPMVATPICYDQFANAEEIEKLGIGRSVNFTDITGPKISELLDQVLHDSQFKAKAKQWVLPSVHGRRWSGLLTGLCGGSNRSRTTRASTPWRTSTRSTRARSPEPITHSVEPCNFKYGLTRNS